MDLFLAIIGNTFAIMLSAVFYGAAGYGIYRLCRKPAANRAIDEEGLR